MAISLVNHATGTYIDNPDITYWEFTIPTVTGGGGNILEISIVTRSANNSAVTAVTVGGQSASLIRRQLNGGVPNAEVWAISNPNSGTSVTCAVTFNLAVTQKIAARAREITGTNGEIAGLTTNGVNGSASDRSLVVATSPGDYVMDTLAIQGTTTTTVGSDQTEDADIVAGSTAEVQNSGSRETANSTTTTMSWTHSPIGNAFIVVVYRPVISIEADLTWSGEGVTTFLQERFKS